MTTAYSVYFFPAGLVTGGLDTIFDASLVDERSCWGAGFVLGERTVCLAGGFGEAALCCGDALLLDAGLLAGALSPGPLFHGGCCTRVV